MPRYFLESSSTKLDRGLERTEESVYRRVEEDFELVDDST